MNRAQTYNSWETLSFESKAEEKGYVSASIRGTSASPVLFDNFEILSEDTYYARLYQENHYYPFGMNMKGLESSDKQTQQNKKEHLWQYNGKERQDDFDLFWLDYGARNYDAQLGRFHTVDRFSEKYYSLTAYQYAANNPISFIDVNGDSLELVGQQAGRVMDVINKGVGIDNAIIRDSKTNKLILNISVMNSENLSSMTNDQKKYLSEVLGVINSKENNIIEVVDNDKTVSLGDAGFTDSNGNQTSTAQRNHRVDIGDIEKFGESGIVRSSHIILHEMVEKQAITSLTSQGQSGKQAVPAGHTAGIQAEARISLLQGVIRYPNDPFSQMGAKAFPTVQNGQADWSLTIKYAPSSTPNKNKGVYIFFKQNNITKIYGN